MNHAQIFLSTHVTPEKLSVCSVLSGLGNLCLIPIDYFFHGRYVQIISTTDGPRVDHVRTFHPNGDANVSRFESLVSHEKGFLKTVAAIIFFIPGLFLGSIFKGLSYLSETTRDQHELVKKHFTPINITIGSDKEPLDEAGIKSELEKIQNEPLHQKINALIIYGQDDVRLNTDPGFVKLNPKKVILAGPRIIHEPCAGNRLDDMLSGNKKWMSDTQRSITENKPDCTFVKQLEVESVNEALAEQRPRRPWSLKRYHVVYVVPNLKSSELK